MTCFHRPPRDEGLASPAHQAAWPALCRADCVRRRRVAVAAVASGPRVAALPSGDRPRTVAEIESQLEAQIDSDLEGKAEGQRRLPVLTRRVAGMAQKEPENTAKLIRSWMSDREDA